MGNHENSYDIQEAISETRIQYVFISEGISDIIKAIQYSYVHDFLGRKLFNLGFGDYDLETDAVADDCTSNNGDHYKVFNTVLSTITMFFSHNPKAMLMVQGSDSRQEFVEQCRLTCRKRCGKRNCKNADRRIGIYRNYVDKNLEILSLDYTFYGQTLRFGNHVVVENYRKRRPYKCVFLVKKES